MGANLVNAIAEGLAPDIERLTGGEVHLRILSNLADERLVSAVGRVPLSLLANRKLGLTGQEVADRVVKASVFAEMDPHRAATHNKGLMNGLDAVLLATGQDWRAVSAGAHAYCARDGRYTALSVWRREGDELVGRVTMPMQVGTVGGVTKVHPVVKVLLKVLDVDGATHLAGIAVSVGLAQNLAAILALATEGIQRGHMSLHARNIAASVGARDEQIDQVVREMVRTRSFNHATAAALFEEICR
jgi:hydroxymethylglutaryl-CoA reductase